MQKPARSAEVGFLGLCSTSSPHPQLASPPGLSSLEAWALSDSRLFWICLHLASLSLAEVNALKQRVTILDGHLRRFQNAFSQYKKGEFLDLTLARP